MGPVPVVVMQPRPERMGALFGAVIGACVGPLAQGRLNQTFGLAVGARSVRTGAHVQQAQSAQQPAEAPGLVAGTVVGHDTGEGDTQAAVVAQRPDQHAAGAGATLVRLDGRESNPGVVDDCQVDILPPGAIGGVQSIPGDPVSGAPEAAQFLDVQVQQVPGLVMLVALDGRGWVQFGQPVQTGAVQQPCDRTGCYRQGLRNLVVGVPGAAQGDDGREA